ncbi:MAG TPA: gamma-glutamyl-gamma-aminobutyrate hydrolase family protein [Candidatus Saccharimonadales bacterium]|jgi:putative glutamine amidotransferase|nr:gamma-glutamyl-gamma-aminobutyrate hydrolase family protein [Candidatus Saccharimonadales bacterium]
MKPIIAVTAGLVPNRDEPWAPETQGQSHTYIDAIVRAGGVPFIVPVVDDEAVLRRLYDLADGILFAGGNDLDPKLYGEEPYPGLNDATPVRDAVEIKLMRWALADRKPFLGICRGMQLLNVLQGGTCYQDIPTDLPDASDHNSSTKRQDLEDIAHHLRVQPGSQFATIIGADTIGANTHHHQALKKLGTDIIANCWSEDGLIEGIELTGGGLAIGVQSHPESLDERAEVLWRKFFAALTDAAKNNLN